MRPLQSAAGDFLLGNNLLSGGVALELIDDGSNSGCQAAIRRQRQIFLIRSHSFFVFLCTLVSRAQELVNYRLRIRKLINGLAKLEDGFVILALLFQHSRQADVRLRLNSASLSDCPAKWLDVFVREGSLAINAPFH